MPTHPFASLLGEYKIALSHLVPTVPKGVKVDAEKMLEALQRNSDATEDDIRAALVKTGMAEYPHRRAFRELHGARETNRRLEMVLEHVDENVRAKLKKHLDAGVPLEELVKSHLFETEFTPEERHQIEDGILDADDHVKEEMEKAADASAPEYQKLLKKWHSQLEKIVKKIDELEALKNKDPKWKEEIEARVARFREGLSVTEPDPELVDIEKEIEYWKGTFGEEI
jgi:hypothetical protein